MIKPFADDKGSSSIGDLSVENGTTAVVVSGSLEVTRDKAGLKRAHALKELADSLVEQLTAAHDLPDKLESAQSAGTTDVANPFA